MAQKISSWLLLVCTLALVGCDHATKLAASCALRGRTVTLVPGILDLEYAENRDVAFSVLRHVPIPGRAFVLLMLAAVGLGTVAFFWWKRRARASALERFGWALTLAGAAGNLVDRLVRGYVVDFIHLHHWPVFNVADIAVVAGVAVLLVGTRAPMRPAPS